MPIDWKYELPELSGGVFTPMQAADLCLRVEALRRIAEELYLLRRHFMVLETEMAKVHAFGAEVYKNIEDLEKGPPDESR